MKNEAGDPIPLHLNSCVKSLLSLANLLRSWGHPVTHWTPQELALEVVKQSIVESISVRHIGRFLKGMSIETASVTILANE